MTQSLTTNKFVVGSGIETVRVQIQDKDSMARMFRDNIYDNRMTAAVIETVANAIDAHVRAGVDQHVRVRLEKCIDSNDYLVTVYDFGAGMSEQEFIDKYIAYCTSEDSASSKFGGFGIGSKVTFGICDKPTHIATVHDGVVTDYIISEDGLSYTSKVLPDDGMTCGTRVHFTVNLAGGDVDTLLHTFAGTHNGLTSPGSQVDVSIVGRPRSAYADNPFRKVIEDSAFTPVLNRLKDVLRRHGYTCILLEAPELGSHTDYFRFSPSCPVLLTDGLRCWDANCYRSACESAILYHKKPDELTYSVSRETIKQQWTAPLIDDSALVAEFEGVCEEVLSTLTKPCPKDDKDALYEYMSHAVEYILGTILFTRVFRAVSLFVETPSGGALRAPSVSYYGDDPVMELYANPRTLAALGEDCSNYNSRYSRVVVSPTNGPITCGTPVLGFYKLRLFGSRPKSERKGVAQAAPGMEYIFVQRASEFDRSYLIDQLRPGALSFDTVDGCQRSAAKEYRYSLADLADETSAISIDYASNVITVIPALISLLSLTLSQGDSVRLTYNRHDTYPSRYDCIIGSTIKTVFPDGILPAKPANQSVSEFMSALYDGDGEDSAIMHAAVWLILSQVNNYEPGAMNALSKLRNLRRSTDRDCFKFVQSGNDNGDLEETAERTSCCKALIGILRTTDVVQDWITIDEAEEAEKVELERADTLRIAHSHDLWQLVYEEFETMNIFKTHEPHNNQ